MKFTFPPESKPLEGYTIKRAIHRGGFGEVYYALSDAGKEVALKLLNNNLDVELRGVTQCLNLKHPNLLTLFDIRTDEDGDHWIVMEYVSGGMLTDNVEQHPDGMPVELVESWLSGIAAGLNFLHDRGIVHRDLKPANIHREQGVVKIGDVGLSKFISESRRSAQTQSVGTVYYMAPEVARGRYGREVDIYSLGIILYELLTGRVPFEGETTAEILMKHLTEHPDLSLVPDRLRPVIGRALAKDPQERYADALRLEQDFRTAVRGGLEVDDIPEENFSAGPADPTSIEDSTTPDAATDRTTPAAAGTHRKARENTSDGIDPTPRGLRNSWKRLPEPLRWFLIGLAALIVLRGGGAAVIEALAPAAILGGIGYVVYYAFRAVTRTGARHHAPTTPRATMNAVPETKVRKTVPIPPDTRQASHQQRTTHQATRRCGRISVPGPPTVRSISMRQRMIELSGSMTVAVICTLVITASLALITDTFGLDSDFMSDRATQTLFGVTTLIASWAILVPAKLYEGTHHGSGARRITFLAVGAAAGLLAGVLSEFLLVDLPGSDAIFSGVGRHSLLLDSGQPVLLAHSVFFAGLFALRRWWWLSDSYRPRRFRTSSALLTLFVGFVMTTLFSYPAGWGAMLALAVACVVQLSAVWIPPDDRSPLRHDVA